jgi:hypothetical protein
LEDSSVAIQSWKWLAMLLILAAGTALAEQPNVEDLPPPVAKSVLAKETLKSAPTEVSDSAATELGWGIFGPLGRLYCVGDLTIVDYLREGRRYIVTLMKEDPASHARIDPHFLYFREAATGHRWAIGRQVRIDGTYGLYFQAADEPGHWKLFQRSRLIEEGAAVLVVETPIVIDEPGCGH